MKQKIISEIMTDITILLLVVVGILNIVRFHIIEKAIEQLQERVETLENNSLNESEVTTMILQREFENRCDAKGGTYIGYGYCKSCGIYGSGLQLCFEDK